MVAVSESMVRDCECGNSRCSNGLNAGWTRSVPSSLPTWRLALLLVTVARPATHSTRSSSWFHSAPTTPPGRSTRAISANARSTSNQWNAWPASTASIEASGKGIRSAVPVSAVTDGNRLDNSASMPASGSTAVTDKPRDSNPSVSFPVPAARSSTSRTGRWEPASTHRIPSIG
jgi:hypothetical protein